MNSDVTTQMNNRHSHGLHDVVRKCFAPKQRISLGADQLLLELRVSSQLLRQIDLLLEHNDIFHFASLLAFHIPDDAFVQSVSG